MSWGMTGLFPLICSVKSTGSIMIGGSGGYSSSTTTTTTDQWGVSLSPAPGTSPPFGPPNWGQNPNSLDPSLQSLWGAAVAKYGFALVHLPDPGADAPAPLGPGYWVRELVAYGNLNAAAGPAYLPASLDPTMGCWKIVYVVLSIQTNADLQNNPPTYTYCYTDPDFLFGGSFCV